MQTRRIAKAVKGFNKEQMFADKLSLVAFQIQSQNTWAVALLAGENICVVTQMNSQALPYFLTSNTLSCFIEKKTSQENKIKKLTN